MAGRWPCVYEVFVMAQGHFEIHKQEDGFMLGAVYVEVKP